MPKISRREILAGAAAVAAAGAPRNASAEPWAAAKAEKGKRPGLCLFSKPLPHLDYPELAKALKDVSIPGVDLTVRPGGHVSPERVSEDLPKATEALKKQGIGVSMITTGLTSIDDPAARPTLYTAAKLGIPFFKLGYYRYRDVSQLESILEQVKRNVEGLTAVASHAKVQGGFHNHSGTYVGAAMWDHWWVLRDANPDWMGFYFDICHATIEGGAGGWEIGFHRLASRLKMAAIKDFYWEKHGGKWTRRVCPLGQGMIDLPKFLRILAASGFSGPISLHIEYEIEAPTESARREKVIGAIDRDYKLLKKEVEAAYA